MEPAASDSSKNPEPSASNPEEIHPRPPYQDRPSNIQSSQPGLEQPAGLRRGAYPSPPVRDGPCPRRTSRLHSRIRTQRQLVYQLPQPFRKNRPAPHTSAFQEKAKPIHERKASPPYSSATPRSPPGKLKALPLQANVSTPPRKKA